MQIMEGNFLCMFRRIGMEFLLLEKKHWEKFASLIEHDICIKYW